MLRRSPHRFVSAVLVATSVAIPARAQHAPADTLPTGDALLEQCIEAMGGVEVLDAVKSAQTKLHIEFSGMGTLTFNLKWASPAKFAVDSTSEDGDLKAGSDGTTHWLSDSQAGYMVMSDEQWKGASAQFRMLLGPALAIKQVRENAKSLTTVGKETFNDTACYKVNVINEAGEASDAFFDVNTHLLAGFESEEETPLGSSVNRILFSEYKPIEEITTFTRLIIDQAGLQIVVNYDAVTFNAVPDEAFALPDEVQRMVDEAKRAADDDDSIGADDIIDDDMISYTHKLAYARFAMASLPWP